MQTLIMRTFFSKFIRRNFYNDFPYIKYNSEKYNFNRCFSQFKTQALIPFVVEQTVYMFQSNEDIILQKLIIYIYIFFFFLLSEYRQEENDRTIYFPDC